MFSITNEQQSPLPSIGTSPHAPSTQPSKLSLGTVSRAPTRYPSMSLRPSEKRIGLVDKWFIEFENSFSNISDSGLIKEFLQYRISKGKSEPEFVSSILDQNCTDTINETNVVILENTILVRDSEDLDKAIVSLHFNESSIEKSILWKEISSTKGLLSFCVKTELLLLGDDTDISVSFCNTKVFVNINFLASYGNFEINDIDLVGFQASEVIEDDKFDVMACICEINSDEDHQCQASPTLNQNSIFRVCVNSPNGLQVTRFESVVLKQDLLSIPVIDHGETNELSKVIDFSGVVEIRMMSLFFSKENPSPLTILGEVVLGFVENRRLNNEKSEKQNQKGNFQIDVKLEESFSLSNENVNREPWE